MFKNILFSFWQHLKHSIYLNYLNNLPYNQELTKEFIGWVCFLNHIDTTLNYFNFQVNKLKNNGDSIW